MTESTQKEAAVCSHQDSSRRGVGMTAHMVAILRGVESCRSEKNRLINDPFAPRLAGETANNYLGGFLTSVVYFLAASEILRTLLYIFSPFLSNYSSFGLIDGIAIRSRRIDDEITYHTKNAHIKQIAVLGAGLDARPWRLSYEQLFGHDEAATKIKYFELDFQEIFDYKLPVVHSYFEEKGLPTKSNFEYIPVVSDLSLSTWPETLINAGFDPTVPTLWILEGFTGYLTEFELRQVLTLISDQLSAKSSRFIGTFIRPEALDVSIAKGLHQSFRPAHPAQLVSSFGWTNATEESFDDIGKHRYSRPIYPTNSAKGHVIVTAEKK